MFESDSFNKDFGQGFGQVFDNKFQSGLSGTQFQGGRVSKEVEAFREEALAEEESINKNSLIRTNTVPVIRAVMMPLKLILVLEFKIGTAIPIKVITVRTSIKEHIWLLLPLLTTKAFW